MLGISFLTSKRYLFPLQQDIRMLNKVWLKYKYKESRKKSDESIYGKSKVYILSKYCVYIDNNNPSYLCCDTG